MKSIFVTYDLVGTDEASSDYENLIKRIQAYPKRAKVAKSAWVVKTDDTAKQVRDALWDHMDGNDRLFVAVLTGVAAWQNVICKNDWLKQKWAIRFAPPIPGRCREKLLTRLGAA